MTIANIDIHDDGNVTVSQHMTGKVMSKNIPYASIYARFFNKANRNWSTDPEINLMFLKCQERYATEVLKSKGYLFLNDVYDMLGIPRSKIGQCVGWMYNLNTRLGDNYVDFGLSADHNRDFIRRVDNIPLLDFNVDGLILDKI